MTEEKREHAKMIAEYGLGLKIVKAHLTGADEILTNMLLVTKDPEERSKGQFVKKRLQQCLAKLKPAARAK